MTVKLGSEHKLSNQKTWIILRIMEPTTSKDLPNPATFNLANSVNSNDTEVMLVVKENLVAYHGVLDPGHVVLALVNYSARGGRHLGFGG